MLCGMFFTFLPLARREAADGFSTAETLRFAIFATFVAMKQMTDAEYILRLIDEGEHQQQDFKFEVSDACKIARSLSAFANTDGGRLLVGVKDNGKIAGVRSEEETYMIEAAAQVYCSPTPECEMRAYHVEGKTVLKVDVLPCAHRPVYAKDEQGKRWAYVRIHDENILASPVHLDIWKQAETDGNALLPFTERERALLQLLAGEEGVALNQFCRKARIRRSEARTLLAQFIRYGIVETVFRHHTFLFRLGEVS